MARFAYEESVFLNCPFDEEYDELFWAIVFTVHDCGFVARCALEVDDSSDSRIDRIYRLIDRSRLGIHDISRTELDPVHRLPRFNMPLELGIFLGAKRYGGDKHRDKRCLVLDRERYRFQKFCSDIAGSDIKAHDNDTGKTIRIVRDWLRQWVRAPNAVIPGGATIYKRYQEFSSMLPTMCEVESLDPHELSYVDHHKMIVGWLRVNSRTRSSRRG